MAARLFTGKELGDSECGNGQALAKVVVMHCAADAIVAVMLSSELSHAALLAQVICASTGTCLSSRINRDGTGEIRLVKFG